MLHGPALRRASLTAFAAFGLVLLAACGGGSGSKTATPATGSTPGTAKSAAAGKTSPATPATPIPNVTVHADGTATNAQGTPIVLPTAPPATATSRIADATPGAPIPNVTIHPNGTATNSEGTPVVLPTAAAVATGIPQIEQTAIPVTPGIASGAIISIDSLPDASGDFSINVNLSGVTQPYVAFNVYVAFDPAVLSAVAIRPGAALAPSVEEMLCVKLPAANGAVGIGCTVFDAGATSTSGVLATIKFRRIAAGTTGLHLRSLAEGGATNGTFTVTPQGTVRKPDIVTLNDGTVTTS